MKKLVAFSLVICVSYTVWGVSRLNMIEVGIPYAQPASPNASLSATSLGVTTLLFDDGETQIMTDGFMPRHWDDLQMRRSFLVSAASASLIPNIFSITFVQQCKQSRLGEFILITTVTFMRLLDRWSIVG